MINNPKAYFSQRGNRHHMNINMVSRLPKEDAGLQHSIVRFNNVNIDSKRENNRCFFRREPVVIINAINHKKVLRYAMGNPGSVSICKDWVALDYDAMDILNVKYKTEVDLVVRRATTWEQYLWYINHPDLSVQMSIRLGVLGGVLGVMGFLAGVLPALF